MKYLVFFAFPICFLICLNACSNSKQAKAIEGSWNFTQTLSSNSPNNSPMSSTLTWKFDEGNFSIDGYPPLFQKGKYRVLTVSDSLIQLKLIQQTGDLSTEDRSIKITLHQNGQISIDNQGPFQKIK